MQLIEENYDIVIIGGGAVGSGILLDATLRGYKAILLEKNDFASGASSKSSKLVHGGVRYLEKAIKNLDKSQSTDQSTQNHLTEHIDSLKFAQKQHALEPPRLKLNDLKQI